MQNGTIGSGKMLSEPGNSMDVKQEKWPTFLIIGVAKAGTTSLWGYLKQHPEVFVSPIKETNYFAYDGSDTSTFSGHRAHNQFPIKTRDEYLALFSGAAQALAVGEVSPLYIESPVAADRIRRDLPRVRLIAILRNPADRAVSDYQMWVRSNRASRHLESEFGVDRHVVRVGFYFEKLKRYFDRFPREQINVSLFDDLRKDALGFVRGIYRFLGVDPAFEPDVAVRYATGRIPRNSTLHAILSKARDSALLRSTTPVRVQNLFRALRDRNTDRDFKLPDPLRARLLELYRDDVLRVGDLIRKDLSHWLTT